VVRVFSDQEVAELLSMADAVDVMAGAFRELGAGEVIMPQRSSLEAPEHGAVTYFMPAYSRATGMMSEKTVSVYPNNAAAGRPVIQAMLSLFDGRTGTPLAVMDAGYLTALRTGAVSGLATRLLARPDSEVLGVLGAGVQARTQIWGACAVRPIRRVQVYSPALDREWDSLVAFLGPRVSAEIVAAADARAAVLGADIVATATTSRSPALDGSWLEPGVHVNAVGNHTPGSRELDTATVSGATVICDYVPACLVEAGDLLIPLREGAIGESHYRVGLADVLAGRHPGRKDALERTVFKSVGLAVEDLAAAAAVYHRAAGRKNLSDRETP
jgi:ornithine cyclodeaminase/alanine dehydrogenase-like protein (mu-crystallin family)